MPDPIGQAGGLNLYAYCGNDPVNRIDPTGNDWDWNQYRSDVGQVFLGYGDVLNPWNMVKGTFNAGRRYGQLTFDDPIFGGTKFVGEVGMGLYNTLTDWSSPRAFGRSWATGSLIVFDGASGFANPSYRGEAFVFRASMGNRMFGIGVGTADEAFAAGRAFVGPGARVSSNGSAWVSKDGLRQFRKPSWKPRQGKVQANFESRSSPRGPWTHNGHLDVRN